MAPHSSTLAWKIPWTEEPGRLQSMGSLRVAMQETQVQFLGAEDPLVKGMTTHSTILARKISMTEEPGGL